MQVSFEIIDVFLVRNIPPLVGVQKLQPTLKVGSHSPHMSMIIYVGKRVTD